MAADHKAIELGDVLRVMLDIVPPALLILAVLGSIFAGIATVTEASGIGALGATVLAAGLQAPGLSRCSKRW